MAALWAGLLFVYLQSAPPDITFEDTALFAGACATLGLPHPPGYPLYTFSCWPLTWLFAALGFAPALGAAATSALFAATACLVLALLLRRITGSRAGALLAAGLLGLAPSYWDQAQIPETYTLNVLLLAVCWYISQRLVEGAPRRWLQALALFTGLGLANHWPLFVIPYPALLLWLGPVWPSLLREARDVRFTLSCLAAFAAGLLPYLHLFFIGPDAFQFDSEYQAADFLAYVSREVYGVGGATLTLSTRLGTALATTTWFVGEYAYLFGVVAIAGLVLLGVRRHYWQLTATAWAMLSSTAWLALLRPFDAAGVMDKWIFHVYPLPAYAFATLPLALATQWLLSRTRWHFAGETSLVLACLAAVAVWQFPEADRRTDILADWQARLVLERVPDGALLLSRSSDFQFPLYYVELFTNPRPDLEIVPESRFFAHMTQDGGVSKMDEKKLAAQKRPVAFITQLQLKTLGSRFHGTHYTLDGSVPAGQLVVDLDADARKYATHVYGMRQRGVRNAFTEQFVERTIIDYVLVLEAARLRGAALAAEDLGLLHLLATTPEGQFAKFITLALNSPTPPNLLQLEAAARKVEPFLAAMSAVHRADVLHLLAVARIAAGQLAGGQVLLERALAEHPSATNFRVLIDLLQVAAAQGNFEEYRRLRLAYPGLDSGTALTRYDARCEVQLLRICRPSLQ